jgi:hypothetical protein
VSVITAWGPTFASRLSLSSPSKQNNTTQVQPF